MARDDFKDQAQVDGQREGRPVSHKEIFTTVVLIISATLR